MLRVKSRGVAAFLVVSLLAVLITGCTADHGAKSPVAEGPLRLPKPHAWGHSIEVGEPFADGLEVLRLQGSSSATIQDIELIGAPGVELVGAMLLPPGRENGSIQVAHSWPPRDRDIREADLIPANGATIDADEAGWELFLGLEAQRAGESDREGVRIDYIVDGQSFSTVVPAFLRVCAVAAGQEEPRKCEPPENWLDSVT